MQNKLGCGYTCSCGRYHSTSVICTCKKEPQSEIKPTMQKQLITDQLIEEYQKAIKSKREYFDFIEGDDNKLAIMNHIAILEAVISDLHSLRQQEVQNVIDAHFAGIRRLTNDPAKASTDYFTQTFEQKGGGNGK